MINDLALHESLRISLYKAGIHPVFAMSCTLRVPLRFVPTLVYNDDDVDDGSDDSESDSLLHYRNKSVFVSNVCAIIPAPFKCQMLVKFPGVEFWRPHPCLERVVVVR